MELSLMGSQDARESSEPQQAARWEHEDAQNDLKVIAVYDDLGIGPMVLFDGAGFLDPAQVRAFAADLNAAADRLEQEKRDA